MNARLRMYKYCYSNLGAIYAKGLCSSGCLFTQKVRYQRLTHQWLFIYTKGNASGHDLDRPNSFSRQGEDSHRSWQCKINLCFS